MQAWQQELYIPDDVVKQTIDWMWEGHRGWHQGWLNVFMQHAVRPHPVPEQRWQRNQVYQMLLNMMLEV